MKIFPFNALKPNLGLITSPSIFFGQVKQEFSNFEKAGMFVEDVNSGMYVYEINRGGRKHLGLIATANIGDYNNNVIIKHEKTIAKKEQKQIELLLMRRAQVKPILLAIDDIKSIRKFLRKQSEQEAAFSVQFEDDKSVHTFYPIVNLEDIKRIQSVFDKRVNKAYIADGHHRTAAQHSISMANKNNFENKDLGVDTEQLLCAFFGKSELEIFEFNRIVRLPSNLNHSKLVALLSSIFEITVQDKLEKPNLNHEITLLLQEETYNLKWKPEILNKYIDFEVLLDVQLLNKYVLNDIFGIHDIRSSQMIKYVEGTMSLSELYAILEKSEFESCAFVLRPMAMSNFINLVGSNQVLPPKSTWFEPRIKNGLIVKKV